MNKALWFALLALLTFGIWLWTKVRTAVKLDLKILTPENINISGLTLKWLQPVQVINPTNTGIFVKLIQFNVLLGTNVLGSGFYNDAFTISAAGLTVVKVPCSISFLDLITASPDLVKSIQNKKVSLDFKGNINAEGFTIGIEQPVIFTIPKLKL
jgi:LEA14-like dessication related protein